MLLWSLVLHNILLFGLFHRKPIHRDKHTCLICLLLLHMKWFVTGCKHTCVNWEAICYCMYCVWRSTCTYMYAWWLITQFTCTDQLLTVTLCTCTLYMYRLTQWIQEVWPLYTSPVITDTQTVPGYCWIKGRPLIHWAPPRECEIWDLLLPLASSFFVEMISYTCIVVKGCIYIYNMIYFVDCIRTPINGGLLHVRVHYMCWYCTVVKVIY